jgi:hypothetical protein
MVDFAALLNRTPEESKAIAEKMRADFVAQMEKLVADRIQLLDDIEMNTSHLSVWELQFVQDLQRKAKVPDLISGQIGGTLSCLTDRQVERLTSIHTKHLQVRPIQTMYPQRQR